MDNWRSTGFEKPRDFVGIEDVEEVSPYEIVIDGGVVRLGGVEEVEDAPGEGSDIIGWGRRRSGRASGDEEFPGGGDKIIEGGEVSFGELMRPGRGTVRTWVDFMALLLGWREPS